MKFKIILRIFLLFKFKSVFFCFKHSILSFDIFVKLLQLVNFLLRRNFDIVFDRNKGPTEITMCSEKKICAEVS